MNNPVCPQVLLEAELSSSCLPVTWPSWHRDYNRQNSFNSLLWKVLCNTYHLFPSLQGALCLPLLFLSVTGLPLLCFSNSLCCGIPISGLTGVHKNGVQIKICSWSSFSRVMSTWGDTGPGDASALICACTSVVWTAARAAFRLRACWSWSTEGMEAILMLERMSHLQHCPKPPLYYAGDMKVL